MVACSINVSRAMLVNGVNIFCDARWIAKCKQGNYCSWDGLGKRGNKFSVITKQWYVKRFFNTWTKKPKVNILNSVEVSHITNLVAWPIAKERLIHEMPHNYGCKFTRVSTSEIKTRLSTIFSIVAFVGWSWSLFLLHITRIYLKIRWQVLAINQ